jgi:hypothetical protein
MNEQSPIVSEFAPLEEAAAYEEWLRQRWRRRSRTGGSSISHDEVMAECGR